MSQPGSKLEYLRHASNYIEPGLEQQAGASPAQAVIYSNRIVARASKLRYGVMGRGTVPVRDKLMPGCVRAYRCSGDL